MPVTGLGCQYLPKVVASSGSHSKLLERAVECFRAKDTLMLRFSAPMFQCKPLSLYRGAPSYNGSTFDS